MNKKERVFQELESELLATNIAHDLDYYSFHQKRYKRVFDFIENFNPQNKKLRVLELGSHYLHTSWIIRELGHELYSVDVTEFWNLDFVKERSKKIGIIEVSENDLSNFNAIDSIEDQFDVILFTEIMEHITFNPIKFWKKIHQKIVDGGVIYISTPNSFSLPNIIRNLKNLLTLKSIGITTEDILEKVTYGHHWKEYSALEIKQYFHQLSEDFEVSIQKYHYKKYELKRPHLLFKILAKTGNFTRYFSEELEIILKVNKRSGWKKELPIY